jgi:hypothetical protein
MVATLHLNYLEIFSSNIIQSRLLNLQCYEEVIYMPYFSQFYQIDVRDSIAKEFTNSKGEVDDMMAGLHERRVRMAEKEYDLDELECEEKKESGN